MYLTSYSILGELGYFIVVLENSLKGNNLFLLRNYFLNHRINNFNEVGRARFTTKQEGMYHTCKGNFVRIQNILNKKLYKKQRLQYGNINKRHQRPPETNKK